MGSCRVCPPTLQWQSGVSDLSHHPPTKGDESGNDRGHTFEKGMDGAGTEASCGGAGPQPDVAKPTETRMFV